MFKKKKASPPKRDLRAIRAEYADLCAKLGEMFYTLTQVQAQMNQTQARLQEINQEAAPLVEAERLAAQQKPEVVDAKAE